VRLVGSIPRSIDLCCGWWCGCARTMERVVCVSGYFDPLHHGHVEYHKQVSGGRYSFVSFPFSPLFCLVLFVLEVDGWMDGCKGSSLDAREEEKES
jgi:hypothetical protein